MPGRGEAAGGGRIIQLDSIQAVNKNYKGAKLVINSDGYVGVILALGCELIDDTANVRGLPAKPAYVTFADSSTHPGDVVGIPANEKGPNQIAIQHSEKGSKMAMNWSKLLFLKGIQIPEGTRMIVQMYPDNDPEYGPVVGFKLKGAEFEAQKSRKSAAGGSK